MKRFFSLYEGKLSLWTHFPLLYEANFFCDLKIIIYLKRIFGAIWSAFLARYEAKFVFFVWFEANILVWIQGKPEVIIHIWRYFFLPYVTNFSCAKKYGLELTFNAIWSRNPLSKSKFRIEEIFLCDIKIILWPIWIDILNLVKFYIWSEYF